MLADIRLYELTVPVSTLKTTVYACIKFHEFITTELLWYKLTMDPLRFLNLTVHLLETVKTLDSVGKKTQ